MTQLSEHPTVKLYNSKPQSFNKKLSPCGTEEIRKLCLEQGADDVGFVEMEREELGGERDDILRAFPHTKSLISIVCRMKSENLQCPSRSVANLEFHHVQNHVDHVTRKIAFALEKQGIRALTPPAGFPMEMTKWPGKIWIVSHKPIAEMAGLGKMGLHRSVIHPRFGSHIMIGTILMDRELTSYDSPLDFDPCIDCKLCTLACPTGAISADGHFNFINCLTHTYREFMGGFTDWAENLADSKNRHNYRARFDDTESVSLWQSLSYGANYKSTYCIASCPAGEEVIGSFLNDRKKYLHTIIKPLQNKNETVYVLPGSDAEEHVRKNFSHKKIKLVGNGTRPLSIKDFFDALPLVFQRNKSEGMNSVYHFTFTGAEEIESTVIIKNKKVTIETGHKGEPDIHIYADSTTWLKFLHKETHVITALLSRKIKVNGPLQLFKSFGVCFGA